MRQKLSAVILSLNEEENISGCLESLKGWVDEIIVCDSFSCDRTVEIAREYTDRVLEHEYTAAGIARNWVIPQASHEWVFVIDCDERVTPELKKELLDILEKGGRGHNGYEIRRETEFFGAMIKHCGWEKEYVTRLFRRDLGRYDERQVHAAIHVEGTTGQIDAPLLHYCYRDWAEYIEILHRYSTWGALELKKQGRKPCWTDMVGRPIIRFFKMFFVRLGFLEGKRGFVLCSLAMFSVFMKYTKLWNMCRLEKLEAGGVKQEPEGKLMRISPCMQAEEEEK
ncbi:glycosyltransferase family 2 protein [Candidatus Hydrogenedentota bacterium]